MSIKITATCGDKSVSIECKRPSWKSVREAYEEINKYYIQGKAQAVFEKIGGEPYKEFLNNEQIIKKQNIDGIAIGGYTKIYSKFLCFKNELCTQL